MTTDGTQGVVRRYLEELLNQGNLTAADEHDPGGRAARGGAHSRRGRPAPL